LILAGGQGERFWPISRPKQPKQFLSIFGNKPLIIQTMSRIQGYFEKDDLVFIIPEELKGITRRYLGPQHFIIEPCRRNTGPAICLAALMLKRDYGEGVLHVMPADHFIKPRNDFIAALKFGEGLARAGYLVTYGIKPDRPETGYGYIKIGKDIKRRSGLNAYRVTGFTEKPGLARAKVYLQNRRYLWNSGIFTFRIDDILTEIEDFMPDVYIGCQRFLERKDKKYFQRIPDVSIDYGVMERTKRLCVVKANFYWDDVGSWLALERCFDRDENSNIILGSAQALETYDSIVYTCGPSLKVYGLNDVIVVVGPSGVLVCKKDKVQDLKKLLKL
jgi:mannose-1-phosphate guanylyltransferase